MANVAVERLQYIDLGRYNNREHWISPNSITPTSPKLPDTSYGEVSDMDHVTGKFRGFKPSQHVEMV